MFTYLQLWFYDNHAVLNSGKCYYMTLGSITTEFAVEDGAIAEEHVVLGITIDSRLSFYSNFKQLWKTVVNKLNALTRIPPFLRHNQNTTNLEFHFYWTIKLLSINMDLLPQAIKLSYKQTSKASSQNNI